MDWPKHIQSRIEAWHRDRFPDLQPGECSLRLLREAVELCLSDGHDLTRITATVVDEGEEQYRRYGPPPPEGEPADVRTEAADIGVVLMALAARAEFDLLTAIAERHEFNLTREVKR